MIEENEILSEIEIAKNHFMYSAYNDNCKKSFLRVLNTISLAIDCETMEDKISKIMEVIFSLILCQIAILDSSDDRFKNSHEKYCKNCKALKYVNEIENNQKRQEIIDNWKAANGITSDDNYEPINLSFHDVLKKLLLKPYLYVVICLMTISPYGVEIVKLLINKFGGS